MIIKDEPYLIEYNVRMGDPECQTILPKLNSDILDIILACCNAKLNSTTIKWHDKKSLCVVLCSKGYPDDFNKNVLIEGIDKLKFSQGEHCYHAGTNKIDGKIYSTGGRVLNFVCLSENFLKSRIRIIEIIKILDWDGGFFREDIGYKVIDE